jgi:predicted amino acid racemase
LSSIVIHYCNIEATTKFQYTGITAHLITGIYVRFHTLKETLNTPHNTMSAPRLEIDLDKLEHNARTLLELLASRGLSITAVTKSHLGSTDIAAAWLRAGLTSLGDSRIENIESLRRTHPNVSMTLIRSPMLSQVDRVVASADISLNTELEIIRALSSAAVLTGRSHGIILMVELGDLREGILPADMESIVRHTLALPGISIRGIGANLACRSGVSPDNTNMATLSALADSLEATFDIHLDIVSGGNSANLEWALGSGRIQTQPPGGGGRINHLRLGESLLLGCETLHSQPLAGLHSDAITLIAEVIESKIKPSKPWGTIAQNGKNEKYTKYLFRVILYYFIYYIMYT